MKLTAESDIIHIIRQDDWMMDILFSVKTLDLPDWWVCAGFVRSKIWDVLHGYNERTPLSDIDVIYFDEENIDEAEENRLEKKLNTIHPNQPWSVKNEARMHLVNNVPAYSSSVDAISKFPETATALGVKLDDDNKLILAAPHGVDDVLNLEVKPTNYFTADTKLAAIYKNRVEEKRWKLTWNRLKIEST